MALVNGQVVADYLSATVSGSQAVHITGSPILAGRYYIGIGVFSTGVTTTGNLSATYTVGCVYSLDALAASFPVTGGTGSVGVTTATACGWTVVSSVPWVTLASASTGAGAKTIQYQIPANTGQPRAGTLTIGSQVYTINQAGAQAPRSSRALRSSDGSRQGSRLPKELFR